MGDIRGFLKIKREVSPHRSVCERVKDYKEVIRLRPEDSSEEQGSRCMDCGTPFCHWGCPIANYIPEWNDLIFHGQWEKAIGMLHGTNNLPEITGRICPAPCEYSCVLGINDDPVTIRENELAIIEHAFKNGLVRAHPPKKRTGKKVAVIGSGPAGLSAADELNKRGHSVTVFEKSARPGGILRYGIPDFKLDKSVLDRRMKIWQKEGIKFVTGVHIGVDFKISRLKKEFDAICLAIGSRAPRDIDIEGRNLSGIHFAMDYLTQSNLRYSGEKIPDEKSIDAKGKKVVIIGGGDTGADCVGTANRQGGTCVTQIEVMPKPADCRTCDYPWPKYPLIFKTSTSHEEGGERQWSILTKKFVGQNGHVKKIFCSRVDFSRKFDNKGCPVMKEITGGEFEIDADLVILAVGFLHPEHSGLVADLGVELDGRGNIKTGADYATSVKKIFAAGDARRGQSLVVWAISEGRAAANQIDKYLAISATDS